MTPFKGILLLILLIEATVSLACTQDGKEGFAPENKLNIPVGFSKGGLTESSFNAVIDKVSSFYAPIIKDLGAEFQVIRAWKDGTVNAYASRPSDKVWVVKMFGGLARHEATTEDGFALVVCHEIGHHIGGAPRYDKNTDWAATEGQADYFGTLKCFRRVFEEEDNEKIVSTMTIPDEVKKQCEASWKAKTNDYYLCLRGAMAGDSLARLLATLGNEAPTKFETPDKKVVTATYEGHPKAQCRLDTYFNGSLCEVDYTVDTDNDDEVAGTCHQSKMKVGVRPLCWFKPKS